MKNSIISDCIGKISDKHIEEAADFHVKKSHNAWLKCGSMAACFCLVFTITVIVLLQIQNRPEPDVPPLIDNGVNNNDISTTQENENISSYETQQTEESTEEEIYVEKYVYKVDEGKFSEYVGGKVISEDMIGDEITDVTLTAGWITTETDILIKQEDLRGKVYSIEGISEEIAAALIFIDKGDALTTTHYYVIMNPDADLTAVKDYVIDSDLPDSDNDVETKAAADETVPE